MKFPRNARIFRGSLDAAPFATVFFLLVIFVLLGSLTYTPGVKVPIRLPEASGLAGTDHPAVAVALDADGQLYFRNQRMVQTEFSNELHQIAKISPRPVTLVVLADKSVSYETLVHLQLLAQDAGVQEMLLATRPRAFAPVPAGSKATP